MKMPEKHDLLGHSLAKEQGIGAILRLQWRTRGRYNGGVFTKTVTTQRYAIIA